jgi:hypothetical protein
VSTTCLSAAFEPPSPDESEARDIEREVGFALLAEAIHDLRAIRQLLTPPTKK